MKQEFEIGVLSPTGSTSIDVLLAAKRAGALAIVDAPHLRGLTSNLHDLLGYLGLRLEASEVSDIVPLLEAFGSTNGLNKNHPFDFVLFTGQCDTGALIAASTALRPLSKRIFREVVSVDEAEHAAGAGVDGLVAKGNESGGRVGTESTFVLLQRLRAHTSLPLWAQGGIGPNTAAACRVAGAQGILLDNQLALAEEADLPGALRSQIAAMDGTETICLGESLGAPFRVHRLRGKEHIKELQALESSGVSTAEFQSTLTRVLATADAEPLCPLGQDAALASTLAARYRTTAGILRAYRQHVVDNLTLAAEQLPLREHSEFAQSHSLRFPIFQGPMTRVSDVAPFADAVAQSGGLPFLALALLREAAVDRLLQETSELLGERLWGVGILGFVPAELRNEQMRAVLKTKPRYALLAGGRPDQAQTLEAEGIATYIHAPSPRLLEMFLRQGSRRFIFEGRECGGHVGPLSSFMLWESALDVLLDFQEKAGKENRSAEPIHVLFAGGIHDGVSAAMVSVLAAKATAAGIRIGVLMGTAYLFTTEAVQSGAIIQGFQEEALACRDTVLLDTEGGHAIRCAPTSYAEEFAATKRRLLQNGATPEEARRELEALNLGRLRLASKGVSRGESVLQADLSQMAATSTQGDTYVDVVTDAPSNRALTEVPVERQKREGMYMIGEVAALRDKVVTVEELHRCVSHGASEQLQAFTAQEKNAATATLQVKDLNQPIAIIGMGCLYPGASNPHEFWTNILQKHDAITEVPRDRWFSEVFYDADPNVPDRVVSKWGGFIDPIHFDPLSYGIPPNTLSSVEPMQLLMLEVVRQTLADAGYDKRPFARERTGVVIGAGGGMADLGLAYGTRCMVEQYLHQVPGLEPAVRQRVLDGLHETLPVMTEDSFPGILANVTAGRVASRFDLGGPNFTVDAACASSLAALEAGVKELRHGSSDLVLVGGVDTQQNPFTFLVFSKTHALSPTGRCRPFDAKSDGIAIGEGVASVLLKRLDDAVRDGDRIYAVLRGIAGGSDGRDKSLTAPSVKGQRRAMQRAYDGLEFTPAAISLVEAHGTGTVVGDRTELESMRGVFADANAAPQNCALGSVKSMIGHTKNAAGIAGLIKATLALHHRTLPPTLANEPNEAVRDRSAPFYLNTQSRPWFDEGTPRRAAVSAFGFGGTNFHAVLEEIGSNAAANTQRPAEFFLFRAASRVELAKRLQSLDEALAQSIANNKPVRLIDLSAAVCRDATKSRGDCRLAIVAKDIEELRTHLTGAAQTLRGDGAFSEHGAVSYGEGTVDGKVALLFPGQGSQSVNMLGELALYFPVVRETFENANRVLDGVLSKPLTTVLFPPPAYSTAEEQEQSAQLDRTEWTQPALGAADCAMLALLRHLGVQPDMLGGHSYGEYVALHAAGVMSFSDLMKLSAARGRIVQETQGNGTIGLLAVRENAARVKEIIHTNSGVGIAAQNAPGQTVIGGTVAAIEAVLPCLDAAKISYQRLAVSAGFHIPEACSAAEPLKRVLDDIAFKAPVVAVYSNRTAKPYPGDEANAKRLLLEHLSETVLFKDQIEQMHLDGARIFVEAGPKSVLSSLTRQTLSKRDATVLSTNRSGATNAMAEFLHTVGRLFVSGVAMHPEKLFSGCELQALKIEDLTQPEQKLSPATWIVDGGKARPLRDSAARKTAQPSRTRTEPIVTAQSMTTQSTSMASLGQETQSPAKPNMTTTSLNGASANGTSTNDTSTSGAAASHLSVAALATQNAVQQLEPTAASTPTPQLIPSGQNPAVVDAASAATVMSAFQTSMQSFLEYQSQAQAQRQQLMSQFLQTQQAVVEAYLASASGQPLPQSAANPQSTATPQAISQPTAQPVFSAPPTATPLAPAPLATAPPAAPQQLVAQPNVPIAQHHISMGQNGTNGYHPAHEEQNGTTPLTITHAAPAPSVQTPLEPTLPAVGPVDATPASEADLQSVVLEMVSEYTGYPIEMLELDQNMEADLGIDSIKRTEIFSGLRDRLGMGGEAFDQEEYFIKIARLRTLQEVIEWLQEEAAEAAVESSVEAPQRPAASTQNGSAEFVPDTASTEHKAPTNTPEDVKDLRRYVVRPQEQPLSEAQRQWDEQQIILVTEDGSARARELVTALHSGGVNVALVRHASATRNMGSGVYEADLLSHDSVQQLKALVEEHHGKITALCHLLSLDAQEGKDDCIAVKSLFHLSQAFEQELRAANGTVIAVTGMGGTFGLQHGAAVQPGQAAVAGFLKSLAQEWPEVFIKALDVDAAASEEFLLPQLMSEIGTADRTVEVGYTEAGRVVLRAVQEELGIVTNNSVFDSDSVLLVTGGARGITAAICEELATRYKPTLVLVGRSPLPHDEAPETSALTGASELKRVLAARRKERGQEVTPLAVEAEYRALLHGREMRANLQRLRSLGARCEYYSLDVRDAQALEALIAATYQKHGRIDGVIHGAGVIEDNLLANKTPEAFNRVFDTKVVAAQTLARSLRPESLRLMVFFSSIAARLGNAGQTDYAAANEALNKLAAELDRKWPGRVVSIGWGPWEGAGMASPLLREHLAKSGLDYLPLNAGQQLFLQEIEWGRKGETEVLLLASAGDGPQQAVQENATDAIARDTVLPNAKALLSSLPQTEWERV